jgi:hypothetical protein
MRLGNMATLAREWAAVQRVELSPFRELLLSCRAGASTKSLALEVPPLLQKHLVGVYNESQLQALMAGLDGHPFVLIQGPPGTGKTQCAFLLTHFLTKACSFASQMHHAIKTSYPMPLRIPGVCKRIAQRR